MNDKDRIEEKEIEKASMQSAEDGLTREDVAALLDKYGEEGLKKLLGGAKDESTTKEAEEKPAQEADNDEGLSRENIATLLMTLGEDIVVDMLEDAGLTKKREAKASAEESPESANAKVSDEAEPSKESAAESPEKPAEESPEKPAEESAEKPEEKPSGKSTDKPKRKRRHLIKGRLPRRLLLVVVVAGLILLPFALNKIYLSAQLNSDDPIKYSTRADDIACSDGNLRVNMVNVAVPSDGTEEYDISYSWAEDDEKYPSVPHAITVTYKNKGEENEPSAYSISLYRNDAIAKSELPEGKNARNWFDDWDSKDEDGIVQEKLDSGDLAGYYIHPAPAAKDEPSSDYTNYSYYFAVGDDEGVSIYVLEGELMDESKAGEFSKIMQDCIQSIKIKMPDTDPS